MTKIKPVSTYLAGKPFLVGEQITYVDFYLFSISKYMEFLTEGDVYTQFPNLKEHYNRIRELPSMTVYFANDANYESLSFNGKRAKINN